MARQVAQYSVAVLLLELLRGKGTQVAHREKKHLDTQDEVVQRRAHLLIHVKPLWRLDEVHRRLGLCHDAVSIVHPLCDGDPHTLPEREENNELDTCVRVYYVCVFVP